MVSIWTLKKQPIQEIIAYILDHSDANYQAKLVNKELQAYLKLSPSAKSESMIHAISQMDEETYDDYLLELIDE